MAESATQRSAVQPSNKVNPLERLLAQRIDSFAVYQGLAALAREIAQDTDDPPEYHRDIEGTLSRGGASEIETKCDSLSKLGQLASLLRQAEPTRDDDLVAS